MATQRPAGEDGGAAGTSAARVRADAAAPERRVEDPALVTGAARFTDDLPAVDAAHAVFVRSIWAHARVSGVDGGPALAMPGVLGVFDAETLSLGRLPAHAAPAAMARSVLAGPTVRFIGEAVAVVVADTHARAVDAVERVEVAYEPLDVVVDPAAALDPEAPLLFPEHGSNLAVTGRRGAGAALDEAEVVVEASLVNQRVAHVPLEPSAALAVPDADGAGLSLWAPSQAPFALRDTVAALVGLAPERVRVAAPWVGGAFGGRIAPLPEQVVVAALCLRLRRPVRYVETREETMVTMGHARAQRQAVRLGARRDGTLVGLEARVVADAGAYPAEMTYLPEFTALHCAGVYRLGRVDFEYRCAVTNTPPIVPYRGAGRPEATALIERTIDLLAARLGIDPAELRRRNLIRAGEFPYSTPAGACYDSGDYHGVLERVLAAADYAGLRAEQAARRRRADRTQLGIGLCCYVKSTGFGGERARCSVGTDGRVTVVTGTVPQGQGHATAWARIVADILGVAIGDVQVMHSDTANAVPGPGTMGSRSLQIGGSALLAAAGETLAKARALAAHLLEADVRDIEVVPGTGVTVAGAPSAALSWAELARAANDAGRRPRGMAPGLGADEDFETPDATYPFGAHLAVVEVDLDTGLTRLIRHVAVDDAGRIIDPPSADGQIHGGIAQGVAQALFEEVAFDDLGNCLTGSLASYGMPLASDLPRFETIRTETPTDRNPLGAKGIGESGATGSTPAVWNAVVDALAHLGVRHVDMPATPERVWRAIQAAEAR